MQNNSPELKPEIRKAYKDATVSPYLLTRVMASTETSVRPRNFHWKFATGIASITLVILLFNIGHDDTVMKKNGYITPTLVSINIPAVRVSDALQLEHPVPGLASLSRVPSMNQFQTPAVSLSSVGDFCIYKSKGDKLC